MARPRCTRARLPRVSSSSPFSSEVQRALLPCLEFISIGTPLPAQQPSQPPVRLSLSQALKLDPAPTPTSLGGASIASLLLQQARVPLKELQSRAAGLSDEDLQRVADSVAISYATNLGKPRQLKLAPQNPAAVPRQSADARDLLRPFGAPGYAALSPAPAEHALPYRSKAFSMQVMEPWACLGARSEEKRNPADGLPNLNQGAKREQSPCVRSLLLEPDEIDDLASLIPGLSVDGHELSGSDEEDALMEGSEDPHESRGSPLFSESIFSSGALPVFPMTQAV